MAKEPRDGESVATIVIVTDQQSCTTMLPTCSNLGRLASRGAGFPACQNWMFVHVSEFVDIGNVLPETIECVVFRSHGRLESLPHVPLAVRNAGPYHD